MSWRVLDFTEFDGSLKYIRGRLQAQYRSGKTAEASLQEIALIITTLKVQITGGLLIKLGELGIPLVVTDWRFIPVSSLQSWSAHTRVGARQIAQANCSIPRRKSAWQALIRAKISGQAQTLDSVGFTKQASSLKELSTQVRSGDPQNCEAQAARFYWSELFGALDFHRDQDSDDFLNAALNYGYTILRGHGIRAVSEAGLWPALGVFHRSRSNAFNLVDDLIEPFRPVVDWAVTQLPQGSELSDPEIRKSLVSCIKIPFDETGYSVSTVLSELCKQYGMYVEGEGSRLKVSSWIAPRIADEKR